MPRRSFSRAISARKAPQRRFVAVAIALAAASGSFCANAQDEILYFNGPNANVGAEPAPAPESAGPLYQGAAPREDSSEDIDLGDGDKPSAPRRAPGCATRNLNGTAIGMTADAIADLKKSALSPCDARARAMDKARDALLNLSRAMVCPAAAEPAGKILFAERQKEVNDEAFFTRIRAKLDAQTPEAQSATKEAERQKPAWAKFFAPFFDPLLKKIMPNGPTFAVAPKEGPSRLSAEDWQMPLEALQRQYFGFSSMAQQDFARIAKVCPAWTNVAAAENAPEISILRVSAQPSGGLTALVMLRQPLGPYSSAHSPVAIPLEAQTPLAEDYLAWSQLLSDGAFARSHAQGLKAQFGDSAMHWSAGRSGEGFDAPLTAEQAAAAAAFVPKAALAKPKPARRAAPEAPADNAGGELEFEN